MSPNNQNQDQYQDQGTSTQTLLLIAAGVGVAAGIISWALMRDRPNRWEKARRRVVKTAIAGKKQMEPWMGTALKAAVGLAAAAAASKTVKRAKSTVAETAETVSDTAAETGVSVLRRLQTIAQEAGKLYPEVRDLIA